MDLILTRRSIRKYKDEPVPEPMIKKILEAGMNAPSADNQQPWQFIIINDRKILDTIPETCKNAPMLTEAPLAILVCGDLELEKHKGFWVQDCSAATENILLAAHGMGLGGVWVGVHPREQRVDFLKSLLNLPEHIIPFALIPIGYPGEEKPPAGRFDQTRVHYNCW